MQQAPSSDIRALILTSTPGHPHLPGTMPEQPDVPARMDAQRRASRAALIHSKAHGRKLQRASGTGCTPHHSATNSAMATVVAFTLARSVRSSNPWLPSPRGP